jgi:hypothetical protein
MDLCEGAVFTIGQFRFYGQIYDFLIKELGKVVKTLF